MPLAARNRFRPNQLHDAAQRVTGLLSLRSASGQHIEALHNGWDKNDPKDAQVILYLLRAGHTQQYTDPIEHGMNDWQDLSKTHEVISKAKTEAMHRLQTHYLPLYFSEIDRFRHNSISA